MDVVPDGLEGPGESEKGLQRSDALIVQLCAELQSTEELPETCPEIKLLVKSVSFCF